jgi:hypothetical protein
MALPTPAPLGNTLKVNLFRDHAATPYLSRRRAPFSGVEKPGNVPRATLDIGLAAGGEKRKIT